MERSILQGHTNESSAYLVKDYPYGFRLRTQIRYWIETTKNGDRFCSQTLNPKTGLWNKPKKSTYSAIEIMYIEKESGYIKTFGINEAYTTEQEYVRFLIETKGFLFNELQQKKLKRIKAFIETRKHITFSINAEVYSTPEQKQAHEAQQAQEKQKIMNLFKYNLSKA